MNFTYVEAFGASESEPESEPEGMFTSNIISLGSQTMNPTQLKALNDETLVNDLKNLVQKEKALTYQILDYLREVETRRLFVARGFSSLFVFCTEYLGYSEPEAQ